MNAQRNQVIIVIVLVVALAGVLVFQFSKKPARPAAGSKKTQTTAQAAGDEVKVAQAS